jgi:hypothetical protein
MAEDGEEEEPKKEDKSAPSPVVVSARPSQDWSPVLKRMAALERKLHIVTGRID